MNARFTQCPQCRTVFSLTARQLEAASGIVRCGNCQQVFNAVEHHLNPQQPAARPDAVIDDEPAADLSAPALETTAPTPATATAAAIEPDPIELPTASSNYGWAALLFAFIIAALAAAGWQFRQTLATHPLTHAAVATLCANWPCQLQAALPAQFTEALTMRPHPNHPGELIISARLTNPAAIKQALPLLKLTITNSRNKVLAATTFTPAEYLPQPLPGKQHQPANSAMAIELRLAEPVGEVADYYLEVLPGAAD